MDIQGTVYDYTGALTGEIVPTHYNIALAASSTTDGMDITVTVKNDVGDTQVAVQTFVMYMSEAATGIGLTGDTYSGDLTASAGTLIGALTAKKAWVCQTNASGVFTATLVASANPADQYVCVVHPLTTRPIVSVVSGTNWEGA
jgi:hypothetical protein